MATGSSASPPVSFGDEPQDSELMNGGPVGPINGGYVNGASTGTNGISSPPSTPRFSFDKDHHNGHSKHAVQPAADDVPQAQPSPRAGTWPASPSPSLVPAEMSPSQQSFVAAAQRHKSHPIAPPVPHEGGAGGPRSRTYARVRTYADGDGSSESRFPRISKPVELLRGVYDCVVIGSGYGGAVAASRMARAGETVCVLERGKEKWPGEYPTGSREALGELHWSGTLSPSAYFDGIEVDGGDPTGMYHLIFGKGQNAVVANGECVHGTDPCDAFPVVVLIFPLHRPRRDQLDERQCVLGGKP